MINEIRQKIDDYNDYLKENVRHYEKQMHIHDGKFYKFEPAALWVIFTEMYDKHNQMFYGEDDDHD